jgi:hypothetical protein
MFMNGDKVSYVGSKFKLAGKLGTVISRVQNCQEELIVDFGEDTYVMHESLLTRYNPSQIKEREEEEPKRKKKTEEHDTKQTRIMISDDDQTYGD